MTFTEMEGTGKGLGEEGRKAVTTFPETLYNGEGGEEDEAVSHIFRLSRPRYPPSQLVILVFSRFGC